MAKKTATTKQGNQSKDKIRRAAMKEFSEKGFSGARVEKIASRAKVNIRMIYYFFGSKKGLLEDVLNDIFQQHKGVLSADFSNLIELIDAYFNGYAADPQRVRLLQWEALQTPLKSAQKFSNFEARQNVIQQRVAILEQLQQRGILPNNLDAKFLYLVLVALSIFPMTFPQTVFIATGEQPDSPEFQQQYRQFLHQLAQSIFSNSGQ